MARVVSWITGCIKTLFKSWQTLNYLSLVLISMYIAFSFLLRPLGAKTPSSHDKLWTSYSPSFASTLTFHSSFKTFKSREFYMIISAGCLHVWLKGNINRVFSCLAGCVPGLPGATKIKCKRARWGWLQSVACIPCGEFVKGDPNWNGQLRKPTCHWMQPFLSGKRTSSETFSKFKTISHIFPLSQIAPECTTIKGMRLQTEYFVFIKTFQIGSSEWCSNTHQNIFMANKHNSILNIYKSMGLHCKLENWVMLVHVLGAGGNRFHVLLSSRWPTC